jgi:hypothetical protein
MDNWLSDGEAASSIAHNSKIDNLGKAPAAVLRQEEQLVNLPFRTIPAHFAHFHLGKK